MDLNIALTDASGSDIDPKDLCSELQIFSNIVPDTVSCSLDALRFIYDHGLNTAVPNCRYSPSYSIDNSNYCCIMGKKFFQVEITKNVFENDNDARTPEQSGNIYRTRISSSLWILHNLFETLLPSKHEKFYFC